LLAGQVEMQKQHQDDDDDYDVPDQEAILAKTKEFVKEFMALSSFALCEICKVHSGSLPEL